MPESEPSSINKRFAESRAFAAKHGYPSGDRWDLPTSDRRFPDGAHFRIEVPTVNSADAVRTLVHVVEEAVVHLADARVDVPRDGDVDQEEGTMPPRLWTPFAGGRTSSGSLTLSDTSASFVPGRSR